MTALGNAWTKTIYVTSIDKKGQDIHFSCNMGQFTSWFWVKININPYDYSWETETCLLYIQRAYAACKLSPSGRKSQSKRQMGIFPETNLFRCTEGDNFRWLIMCLGRHIALKLSGQDLSIILHLSGESNSDQCLRYFQALLEGCSYVNIKPLSFAK